jgi:hypothetical protein
VLGRGEELGELVDAGAQIVLVEDTLAQPTEEPRHPVLEHGAAHREHRCVRGEVRAQRQEVVLVAAGAVQQQERWAARTRQPYVRTVEGADHPTPLLLFVTGVRRADVPTRFARNRAHAGAPVLSEASSALSSAL